MADSDKTSIWKKEISFRRKPKGRRVPAGASTPERPESVAELLRPLAEQAHDPVLLPPVSPAPAVHAPLPSVTPTAGEPVPEEAAAVEAEPEPEPEAEPAPTLELAPRAPAEPGPPKPASLTELVPERAAAEKPKKPSRRERKRAKQEAKQAAKEERRRAKALARETPAHRKHKRLVGLKIGGSQIAAAQIANKGTPRVLKVARAPLERGVVVGGELREPDELASALKAFFRKSKLPRNAVRLGISNNRIAVRTVEISGIDDPKQLANAIRFRAQEAMPIPLDEAVLDYRILSESAGEDGVRTRRILMVVAHRELVDRYAAACKKAGLKLVGVDLEAFALLRAFGAPTFKVAAGDDAGLVVVSIGYDRSTLAVSDGRVCEFMRVLSWGGSALDVAVARALDMTPSEAEPIKRDLALDEEGEGAGLDARKAEEARQAMRAELQTFARELVASLRFYQEQPGSLGIAEILVTGGGAQCRGFAEELERLIGVTVRLGDPLARVKAVRKVKKRANGHLGSLAVAVGLGIED